MSKNTSYKYYVVTALCISKPAHDLSASINTSHATKVEAKRKITQLLRAGVYKQIKVTACSGERD